MKRLVCLAVISTLLVGGAFALYKNSDRFRVLVKKGDKKIDEWVGTDDIKREKIETHIKKLEAAIDRLDDEQGKTEQESKKQVKIIGEQQTKIKNAEAALEKVHDGLTTVSKNDKVSINGRDYNEKELKTIGQNIVDRHKDLNKELKDQNENLKRLEDRAARFKVRKEELEKEVAGLKKDLNSIDAKMKEIETLKRASEAMGDADKTVGENMENLKKSVSELNDSLDRRLSKEDRNWEKVGKSSGDDTDKFIQATKGSPDTLNEIEAILNKNKK